MKIYLSNLFKVKPMSIQSGTKYFWSSFWQLANPKIFMGWSGLWLPWVIACTVICLSTGLIWGFFFTPDDVRQGSTVKIIYLHVPSALMAINGYFLIVVGSLFWLIRRQHVSVLAAKAAAPVGMTMTLIALATGAIWGQPMWGTYWVWDPRLTSFLILFLFYIGYLALWKAIEDEDKAADLTSVLALVGAVFAVLSRYAVLFWNQGLHQGTTVTIADGVNQENISSVFFQPLLLSMVGFGLLFFALLLVGTRTEVRARRLKVLEAFERAH
jgi:heme exporter protein C